jgi:hypothetical protein
MHTKKVQRREKETREVQYIRAKSRGSSLEFTSTSGLFEQPVQRQNKLFPSEQLMLTCWTTSLSTEYV